ncbi:MAG: TonB C-terminal domain-containing protein [Nitrospinota bacterium]|nr:MAG: TonB C-terminal domain-containing protein [Nitrospinota bacterium]
MPSPVPTQADKVQAQKKLPASGSSPGRRPSGEGEVKRGGIALGTTNFPFAYYLQLIEQKIGRQWQPPRNIRSSGKKVVIAFQIQRDGHIQAPVVEESSGNTLLDQTALRAVIDADPFPPLPLEFGEDYLQVHFAFTLADQEP